MPFKNEEHRKAKAREYVAKYRAKKKLEKALCINVRVCAVCGVSLAGKKSNAKFCSKKHKSAFADSSRNWAESYQKNKEVLKQRALSYYHANVEKNRQKMRERQKNNPAAYAKNQAARRAAKLLRTPKWLSKDDLWFMQQAYELASLRTKTLGFAWHVDHVVPLQGKKVSGLHVPWNLQVIPGALNIAKNNSFQMRQ